MIYEKDKMPVKVLAEMAKARAEAHYAIDHAGSFMLTTADERDGSVRSVCSMASTAEINIHTAVVSLKAAKAVQ